MLRGLATRWMAVSFACCVAYATCHPLDMLTIPSSLQLVTVTLFFVSNLLRGLPEKLLFSSLLLTTLWSRLSFLFGRHVTCFGEHTYFFPF